MDNESVTTATLAQCQKKLQTNDEAEPVDDDDDEMLHDHLSERNLKQPLHPKKKQKKFAQQRSILKNSQDHTNDELELIESKKQMILRRRRLFSHYRQYEQWRRRQFSYDPSYRQIPISPGQTTCSDYTTLNGAPRRRRQYKRQYSCAERSREDSRDSRESPSSRKYRHGGIMASDSVCTDSTLNNQTERISVSSLFDPYDRIS